MDYLSIIERFSQKKIAVIGDIILDHYIIGNTSRISPEAPVPVIRFEREFFSPGGGANVTLNLKKLEVNTHLIGKVGKDNEGKILKQLLEDYSISPKHILNISTYKTPLKTRLVSNNQHIVRLDRESPVSNSTTIDAKVIKKLSKLHEKLKLDGIIISDYNKGFITTRLVQKIVKFAKKENIIVSADPKSTDFTKYKGVDILTPNLKEASNYCGFEILDDKLVSKALKYIRQNTEIKGTIITRGKDGTSFHTKKQRLKTIPPVNTKDVFDVTGAGDTFISVFTLSYICSGSFEISAKIANAAAGIVVGRLGTSFVTKEELLEELLRSDGKGKLVSPEQIAHITNNLKSLGKKIVFTNGCFDLIHTGHLKLLRESKKLGDILIVALNTDQSIKRLKGKERPVLELKERISIISALEFVDIVTIFDEDTPLRLIEKVKPHIITKGGDYTEKEVVGKNVVEKYGGKVVIIPLKKGYSTSSIIKKINNLQNNP